MGEQNIYIHCIINDTFSSLSLRSILLGSKSLEQLANCEHKFV